MRRQLIKVVILDVDQESLADCWHGGSERKGSKADMSQHHIFMTSLESGNRRVGSVDRNELNEWG